MPTAREPADLTRPAAAEEAVHRAEEWATGFLFLIPPLASLVLLALLWADLARPRFVAACLTAGIVLQFLLGAPFDPMWLTGLVLNVTVGVSLAIRAKTL